MYKSIDNDSYLFPELKLAYSRKYLNNNLDIFYKLFKNTENNTIYYKNNLGIWCNITKASEQFVIYDLDSLIEKASIVCKLTNYDIDNLPEVKFIDEYGYTFTIISGDGQDKIYSTVTKINIPNRSIEREIRYDAKNKSKSLYVTFPVSIRNALIAYNMILEEYEIVSDNIIKYPNFTSFTNESTYRQDVISVQLWDKTILEEMRGPSACFSGWLRMPYNMNDTYIVTYNKLVYEYKVHPDNPNLIRLITENGAVYDLYRELLDDNNNVLADNPFKVYKLISTDKNIKLEKKVYLGLNPYKNQIVEFPCEINDSMILYEGTVMTSNNINGKTIDFSKSFSDTLSDSTYDAIGWVLIVKFMYKLNYNNSGDDNDCGCE